MNVELFTEDKDGDENLKKEKSTISKPYCINRFSKYKDYQFTYGDDDINGDPDELIKANDTTDPVIYDPLVKTSHLYAAIAKIQLDYKSIEFDGRKSKIPLIQSEKSKKSLLAFCKNYGLLGSYERKYAYQRATERDFSAESKPFHVQEIQVEPIYNYAKDIHRLKLAVELLSKIKSNPASQSTKVELMNIVNSEQSFIYDRLQMDDNKIFPSIFFSSIIDVAWWQLKQALIQDVQYKHCLVCHSIFAVQHGLQKYCPKPSFSDRSKCSNRLSQRKKYKKKGE